MEAFNACFKALASESSKEFPQLPLGQLGASSFGDHVKKEARAWRLI